MIKLASLPDWMVSRASCMAATVLMIGLSASACTLPSTTPTTPDTATIGASLQLCTDEINRYRASIGRPALTRSSSLEQFAADAAQTDAAAGVPHALFSKTNGGGVAMAETELLLWPSRTVQDVITQGLAQMWSAGPSGEHYAILSGPYSQVGCGVYVSGGVVSVTQDYR
jgi:uncharacterized protein YkwD